MTDSAVITSEPGTNNQNQLPIKKILIIRVVEGFITECSANLGFGPDTPKTEE